LEGGNAAIGGEGVVFAGRNPQFSALTLCKPATPGPSGHPLLKKGAYPAKIKII